jgi:hypothetical protein
MDPRLGWKKDPFDKHDFIYATIRREALPDTIDASNNGLYLPAVRNQGNNSACVGFGIGAGITAILKRLGIYEEWTSPQWIWNWARWMEGTLAQNAGVYPGDAYKALLDYGVLSERFWPYDSVNTDMEAPSSLRQSQAVKFPNFAYARCIDGVDGILSGLISGWLFHQQEYCPKCPCLMVKQAGTKRVFSKRSRRNVISTV